MSAWSLENPVFVNYCLCAGILAVKLLLMSAVTGYYRVSKKIFMNDEDVKSFGAKEVKWNDTDVERVRRAHQNDLENIPAFWIIGLLFVLTDPSLFFAKGALWTFTIARITYTFLYLGGNRHRPTIYGMAMLANVTMAINVILFFAKQTL